MLTVEIKVNGTCVKHVYAHNKDGALISTYDVVVANVTPFRGQEPNVRQYVVQHERALGIGRLVADILEVEDEHHAKNNG